MKKVVLLLLIAVLLLVFSSQTVLARENKKGVHILFPEEINKAVELVGPDGWVIIPVGPKDWLQIDKWQTFMATAKKIKFILFYA